MLVKEMFSQLFTSSVFPNNPVWNMKFDVDKMDLVSNLEFSFQQELMALFKTNNTETVVSIIHLHFDELIQRKRECKNKKEEEVFTYLLLVWGICASTQLNWDGEFIYCYDVFTKTIYERVFKKGEEYELSSALSPFKILNFNNTYISNSKSVIEQWFSQLYYYSKSFSGLNDWCEFFFPEVYYYLKEGFQIEFYHPQYLSNLLSWCKTNSDIRGRDAIRSIVDGEFNKIEWSNDDEQNEMKQTLGLQLILCEDYKNSQKTTLYNEIMAHKPLLPLHNMQALAALCFDETNLSKYKDSLISSTVEFNASLQPPYFDSIRKVYQRARVFKSLLGTILLAFDLGKSEIIEKILYGFYDIKKTCIHGSTLFIVPNQLKKVGYCYDGNYIFDSKDTQKIIVELTNIDNKTFNHSRLLKGGVKLDIDVTNKPTGFPSFKYGKEYENKLLELYDFRKIEADILRVKSMCQFDFESFPLQALMIKSIQKTLPINLSLSKKIKFTSVKTVLFWSGFSQTSEIETVALKEIFETSDIVFEIHNEASSSLNVFFTRVDELNPDIIWVSSHGEFQHYEPNLSEIKLSENESIYIRDFEKLTNKGNKRRLLFFNVCEIGGHIQTGEFKNLGFPNLLASENQDVISHLWMAEPRFAYVFGVLFALGVTKLNMTFFEAFEYSLTFVLCSKQCIINEIESHKLDLSELKERIKYNESTEWGNIISTGSPAYYI